MKPRISRTLGEWLCSGEGESVFGSSPAHAYERWQTAVYRTKRTREHAAAQAQKVIDLRHQREDWLVEAKTYYYQRARHGRH